MFGLNSAHPCSYWRIGNGMRFFRSIFPQLYEVGTLQGTGTQNSCNQCLCSELSMVQRVRVVKDFHLRWDVASNATPIWLKTWRSIVGILCWCRAQVSGWKTRHFGFYEPKSWKTQKYPHQICMCSHQHNITFVFAYIWWLSLRTKTLW